MRTLIKASRVLAADRAARDEEGALIAGESSGTAGCASLLTVEIRRILA
jgi:hypothetical protein